MQSQYHTLSVPAGHHHAASSSVLLLIENSLAMAAIWSDIRQQCLEPLLRDFEKANMKVFAVETLPVPASPLERSGTHYGGLDNIRFNGSPDNRLSTAKVNAAIDLLVNSETPFRGRLGTQAHLILVAASSPIDNPLLGIRQYAWFLLAEKLQKANIPCHLVLARNGEDMSSLVGLYDKTRWLQGAVDVHPLKECGRYLLKFAARMQSEVGDYGALEEGKPCKYAGFPLHLPVESTLTEDGSPLTEERQLWRDDALPYLQSKYGGGLIQRSFAQSFPTYPGFETSAASTPSQLPSPPFASYS